MVRALALTVSPSGTFYNLSQGSSTTLFNPDVPEVTAQADFDIQGSQVQFENHSINATGFLWKFDDGQESMDANPVIEFRDGFFKGTLIAYNDCDADTFAFEFLIFTDIIEPESGTGFVAFPNPARDKLVITVGATQRPADDIRLSTLDGRVLWACRPYGNSVELDLAKWLPGIYAVSVRFGDKSFWKKIVIDR